MAQPPKPPTVKLPRTPVSDAGIVRKDFFKIKELPPLAQYSPCLANPDAMNALHSYVAANPRSRIQKNTVTPITNIDFRTVLTGLEVANCSDAT